MVNSLFALLDRHEEILIHNRKGRRWRIRKHQQQQQPTEDPVVVVGEEEEGDEGFGKLHIWTDMMPTDCPQALVDACD